MDRVIFVPPVRSPPVSASTRASSGGGRGGAVTALTADKLRLFGRALRNAAVSIARAIVLCERRSLGVSPTEEHADPSGLLGAALSVAAHARGLLRAGAADAA